MTNTRLLNMPETADRTRMSIDTLRWLRHVGRGPESFKLGRRVMYREEDVEAWIEAQRRGEHPDRAPSSMSRGRND